MTAHFAIGLDDLIKLNKYKTNSSLSLLQASQKTIYEYIQIAFLCRSELAKQQAQIQLFCDNFDIQVQLSDCDELFPDIRAYWGLRNRKSSDNIECSRQVTNKQKSSGKSPFLMKDMSKSNTLDFADGSLNLKLGAAQNAQKFKTLTADDHRNVMTVVDVWKNMLTQNFDIARAISYQNDPIFMLLQCLDVDKLSHFLVHADTSIIKTLLNSVNTALGQRDKNFWFKTRRSLMNELHSKFHMIEKIAGQHNQLSKKDIRMMLSKLNLNSKNKSILVRLFKDTIDIKSLFPTSQTLQLGGGKSFKDFTHELALICLSIFCVIPVIPMVAIWVPYLMDESINSDNARTYENYLRHTFGGFETHASSFSKFLIHVSGLWVRLQQKIFNNLRPTYHLSRDIAASMDRLHHTTIQSVNLFNENLNRTIMHSALPEMARIVTDQTNALRKDAPHFIDQLTTGLGKQVTNILTNKNIISGIASNPHLTQRIQDHGRSINPASGLGQGLSNWWNGPWLPQRFWGSS